MLLHSFYPACSDYINRVSWRLFCVIRVTTSYIQVGGSRVSEEHIAFIFTADTDQAVKVILRIHSSSVNGGLLQTWTWSKASCQTTKCHKQIRIMNHLCSEESSRIKISTLRLHAWGVSEKNLYLQRKVKEMRPPMDKIRTNVRKIDETLCLAGSTVMHVCPRGLLVFMSVCINTAVLFF